MNDEENADRRPEEIRAEIEQTREDLSETVNTIQERLRPGAIASNAADRMKETASEAADRMRESARQKARDVAESEPVRYVRDNPVPVAMVGIGVAGLAWLVTQRRSGSDRRSYRGGEWQGSARDWRSHPYFEGSDFYESDHDIYREVSKTAPRSRSRAGATEFGEYVPERVRRTWSENPLIVGAAATVLGVVVGLAIPETVRENELMGDTRDNMLETVQDAVRDRVTKVQDAASSAANLVQDAAKGAVGLTSKDSTTSEGS
jgi:hypothetical protein